MFSKGQESKHGLGGDSGSGLLIRLWSGCELGDSLIIEVNPFVNEGLEAKESKLIYLIASILSLHTCPDHFLETSAR